MSAFTHGDKEEGLKELQKIWRNMKPRIYTAKEISEETQKIVEEVVAQGLGYYEQDNSLTCYQERYN